MSSIHPELRRCVILFVLTGLCVFYVFGTQWLGGSPFTDPKIGFGAAKFAITLMGILLAHELGHYFVAKRHGFALSLPVFIPVPFAFGTLGAVIQLRSLPKSRSALLEMGAAGPLAGFVLSVLAFCIGLPMTEDVGAVQIPLSDLAIAADSEPGWIEEWLLGYPWLFWPFEQLVLLLEWLGAVPTEPGVPLMILADPPLLKGLGLIILGEVPSRYASLDPIAFAGWVGCLLTAMNLVPIGQLDGGHMMNACAPRKAKVISKAILLVLIFSAVIWTGWLVWAVALVVMRAYVSLPIPEESSLTSRAKVIMGLTVVAFACCFMPQPVMLENVGIDDIIWLDEDGHAVPFPEELRE
ncbi:MAG: site-2 protease family protein [Myxococcota bacterium]